ncbi:MAG: hypothetical protein J5485_02775 [Candidatus Methanomethylophilaceae archaeon]|nr:hypothetical protein [Candidatus Methanomethylophilaceae archaeon]
MPATAFFSSSSFSSTQRMTSMQCSSPSVLRTGALVMASPKMRAFAPPDFVITDMPREMEATSAPSVVARGTRKSPFASPPSIWTGPANPRGIWVAPIMFSMFFEAQGGSNPNLETVVIFAPVNSSTADLRSSTSSAS